MTTISSSSHQFSMPSAHYRCPSDMYRLAITSSTCSPLLRGLHPLPIDPAYDYKMPISANTRQLMFDLTSVYSSGGLSACNHRIL